MAASNTAPAWRRAFLRELARSGSVGLAADKAGIDRTSAYQVRKRNTAFAASWERAQAHARASFDRLRTNGGEEEEGAGRPPLRLRPDECVRASKAGRPCVVRAGPGRWCAEAERAFLDELAASVNVRAAAQAAGVSKQAAYARRRQWPAFAAAWDAARADGWLRLELLLLETATATLEPEPEPGAATVEGPAMSVEQALQLWFHRPGAREGAGRGGRGHAWRRQEPDIEAVRAEVLRRVAAIAKAREKRSDQDNDTVKVTK
jgi:hypothetical protein